MLGPIMFKLLTTSLRRILKKYYILYHKYADDIQLYVIFYPLDYIVNSEITMQYIDSSITFYRFNAILLNIV